MPVQEQTPYIKYVANGVTQTFATEFDCETKDQLVVMLNGEEPVFTSWSYADKQVTFATAPVEDTVVELKRQSKLNRTTDYQSFNHTLNYKALNSDFDRIWYAIQEQNYKAGQYDYDYNFVLTQVRPINTGGTGANNASDARNNLDVYSKGQVDALVATGGQGSVVPIDGGGTGADNAEEARANLDVYSKSESMSLLGFLPYLPTPYPKAIPPNKHMAMMGQSIDQVTYPILFSLYGGTLPDMRGMFKRGLDYGRGIDVGRVVLSVQQDELKSHNHAILPSNVAPGAGMGFQGSGFQFINNKTTEYTGGTETRPKNIAFLYIVKAG